MAISITQAPTPDLLGSADRIVYVVFENGGLPSNAKFRYICEITRESTIVAKLKPLPNSADCGVFDVSGVIHAYQQQDQNKHDLALFSGNVDAMNKFSCKFYYEYATTTSDTPVEYPAAGVTDVTYVVNGTFTPVYNAYDSTNYDNYVLDGSTKKFLSVYQPQKLVAQTTDEGIVGLINGTTSAPWSSNPAYIHVKYYDGTTALNSGYFTSPYVPSVVTTSSNFLIWFGIYPANLETQTSVTILQPSDAGNVGWTHYTVQAASSTTLSGNETSIEYKVTRKPACKYTPIRLAWWNELGGWDYYTFYSKNTHSERIQRSTYREVGGNSYEADGGATDFAVLPYEGGLKVSNVRTTNEWVLNTDPEDEDFNFVVDSIMNSPMVLWNYSNVWRGCVVTDTGIDFKTSVNDKGIVYTVTIEESRYKVTI
jgi:hypothetical protein